VPPARARRKALLVSLISRTPVKDIGVLFAFSVPTPTSTARRRATTDEASRLPPMSFFFLFILWSRDTPRHIAGAPSQNYWHHHSTNLFVALLSQRLVFHCSIQCEYFVLFYRSLYAGSLQMTYIHLVYISLFV